MGDVRKVTKEEALVFVVQMYANTNPTKPHEAKAIKNILQTKRDQNGWRFKNHIFCDGCRRELSALDHFLSGLDKHSPEFIRQYQETGAPGGGTVIYDGDRETPRIQVFAHGIDLTCINCGVMRSEPDARTCGVYFYQRPQPWAEYAYTISMSTYWYEKVMRVIGH
jgi:hypothetical protein